MCMLEVGDEMGKGCDGVGVEGGWVEWCDGKVFDVGKGEEMIEVRCKEEWKEGWD